MIASDMSNTHTSSNSSSADVQDFIKRLDESGDVTELLKTILVSASDIHPSSNSLCQALQNSWSGLTQNLSPSSPTKLPTNTRKGAGNYECTEESNDHHINIPSSKFWAQVALDYSWEQLHIGHWQDVKMFWRQAYALAALLKSLNLLIAGKKEDALHEIDKGILMGAPIINNSLCGIASMISREITLGGKNDDPDVTVVPSNSEGTVKKIGKVRFRNYEPSSDLSIEQKRKKSCDSPTRVKLTCDACDVPLIDMERRIPVINCPSLEDFYQDHMTPSVPVVISGAMDHWSSYAEKKWSLTYLKRVAGPRTVPVEIGSKYTDHEWSQKLMTISEFIENHIIPHERNSHLPKAYLAQHQLFDQIPELREDISVPDYCFLKMNESLTAEGKDISESEDSSLIKINCWIGPMGTVSPLHFDPDHNLLAQVVGRKYIRLYGKSQTPHLYPHNGILSNTSQVDVESPDLIKFPLLKEAEFSEFILHPGQMLYIPPQCWHYVRSLDISFSISFWWN